MEEKNYALIMALFDPENQLGEFCSQLMDEMDKECGKELEDKDPGDIKCDSRSTGLHIGFAVGLVLGQMFEVNDEETAELVTDLNRRMTEKKVLPWQPRGMTGIKKPGTKDKKEERYTQQDVFTILGLARVGRRSAHHLRDSGKVDPTLGDEEIDPLYRLFELIEEKAITISGTF